MFLEGGPTIPSFKLFFYEVRPPEKLVGDSSDGGKKASGHQPLFPQT